RSRLPGQLQPARAVAGPAAAAAGRALEAGHGDVREADHDFALLRGPGADRDPAPEIDHPHRVGRFAFLPGPLRAPGATERTAATGGIDAVLGQQHTVRRLPGAGGTGVWLPVASAAARPGGLVSRAGFRWPAHHGAEMRFAPATRRLR